MAIAEGAGIEHTVSHSISKILAMLGPKGTSDDETDGEGCPKVVRRRKLAWLSEDVSQLMWAVDTYESERRRRQFVTRGNTALERHYQYASIDEARAPVKHLPRNLYDTKWLQNLPPSTRKGLGIKKTEVPLPELVCVELSMILKSNLRLL